MLSPRWDCHGFCGRRMSSDFNFAVYSSSSLPRRALPRPLSTCDQVAAQTILSAKQTVANVFADPLLRAALFDRGYDDTEIRTGEALQTAAESEFVSCQLALACWSRNCIASVVHPGV